MTPIKPGDHGVTEGVAHIMSVSSAPYGQYDTEVFAFIDGVGSSESVLRRCDCPADIATGKTYRVGLYRGLIAYFLTESDSIVYSEV